MSKRKRAVFLILSFVRDKFRFRRTLDFFLRKLRKRSFASYPIEHTTISITQVILFLAGRKIRRKSLGVTHESHVDRLALKFPEICFISPQRIEDVDLTEYEEMIWLTDRADCRALAVQEAINQGLFIDVLPETGPARPLFHDPRKEKILREEFDAQSLEGIENFGYGTGADFENLMQLIDQTGNIAGDIVEVGCFNGSSACVIAAYMKETNSTKKLYVFDYFDGFTFPEAKTSLDFSWFGGHKSDGIEEVKARITKRSPPTNSPFVIKRNICEAAGLKEVTRIALANIDVDMFDAVYSALKHVHVKLSPNGIIIIEDAGHTPRLIGALGALHKFLNEVGYELYTVLQLNSGQYICIKRG